MRLGDGMDGRWGVSKRRHTVYSGTVLVTTMVDFAGQFVAVAGQAVTVNV